MKYINKIVGGAKKALRGALAVAVLAAGSVGCYGCNSADYSGKDGRNLQSGARYTELEGRIEKLREIEDDHAIWIHQKYGKEKDKLDEKYLCNEVLLEHFNLSREMQNMTGKKTNLARHLANERSKIRDPALVDKMTDTARKYVLEELLPGGKVCEAFDTLNILDGGSQTIYSHDKKYDGTKIGGADMVRVFSGEKGNVSYKGCPEGLRILRVAKDGRDGNGQSPEEIYVIGKRELDRICIGSSKPVKLEIAKYFTHDPVDVVAFKVSDKDGDKIRIPHKFHALDRGLSDEEILSKIGPSLAEHSISVEGPDGRMQVYTFKPGIKLKDLVSAMQPAPATATAEQK